MDLITIKYNLIGEIRSMTEVEIQRLKDFIQENKDSKPEEEKVKNKVH